MFGSFVRKFFPGRSPCRNRKQSPFSPLLERLETRTVPASLGVKTAILDFSGETIIAAEMSLGGWGNQGLVTQSSFSGLFTPARPFLDFDNNFVVNQADAP